MIPAYSHKGAGAVEMSNECALKEMQLISLFHHFRVRMSNEMSRKALLFLFCPALHLSDP
jgi:hypothetical protein